MKLNAEQTDSFRLRLLISEFFEYGLPVLIEKIKVEIPEDLWKKELNKSYCFEFWLAQADNQPIEFRIHFGGFVLSIL